MELLTFGRPPATQEIGEGTTEALPPATTRVESLLETVGLPSSWPCWVVLPSS
jgi:hypothetical protein